MMIQKCLVSILLTMVSTFAVASDVPRYVKTISFAKATADILEKSDIDRVVAWAKKHKTAIGRVEGYSCPADLKDRKSDDEKAKLLLLAIAERRANVVLAALVERGLEKSRLTSIAYGMVEDGGECKAQVVFTQTKG